MVYADRSRVTSCTGDLLRRNTTGSAAIFEAAARHNCRRVVFASTGFAYGFANGMDAAAFSPRYLPIDEEHPVSTHAHTIEHPPAGTLRYHGPL